MLFSKKRTIKIDKIHIGDGFKSAAPGTRKLIEKTADYILLDKIQPIIVDKDFNLVDGYCSYLIRKALGEKKVKVIVVKHRKLKDEKVDKYESKLQGETD